MGASSLTKLTTNGIQVLQNRLKIPKLGWVRFHKSQEITGKLVNILSLITSSGKYIASILCETEIENILHLGKLLELTGLKSYLVNTGSLIDNQSITVLNKGNCVNQPKLSRAQR